MVRLSIIIPVYNEEIRLPRTLARTVPFLREKGLTFEVVVVDDGSSDRTVELIRSLSTQYPEVRLMSDGINRGRGAAVKKGIAEARGELILETDADGSVADEAIVRFIARFDSDAELDAIFGSREMKDSRVVIWQPRLRVFLGYGFLFLTRALFWMWSTTDFTLGFKMFRREAAHDIFAHQFDTFFVAEAELVFITKVRGHHAIELPVTWTDDADSRVKPLRDTIRSLRGLFRVLVRYARGKYRS